jgi:hypothetical protein
MQLIKEMIRDGYSYRKDQKKQTGYICAVKLSDLRKRASKKLHLTYSDLQAILGALESKGRLDDEDRRIARSTWLYWPTKAAELYLASKEV